MMSAPWGLPTFPVVRLFFDWDHTAVNHLGSIIHGPENEITLASIQAIAVCQRTGIMPIPISGNAAALVEPVARTLNLRSAFAAELGGVVVVDGQEYVMSGDLPLEGDETPFEYIGRCGVLELLRERFELEEYGRRYPRKVTHPFTGRLDVVAANRLLADEGYENLWLADNGPRPVRTAESPLAALADAPHVYHLTHKGAVKSKAVKRILELQGLTSAQAVMVGDSCEDVRVAYEVLMMYLVANGLQDAAVLLELQHHRNVVVLKNSMNGGFLEAVRRVVMGLEST